MNWIETKNQMPLPNVSVFAFDPLIKDVIRVRLDYTGMWIMENGKYRNQDELTYWCYIEIPYQP